MSAPVVRRLMVSVYGNEDDLLAATRAFRDRGRRIVDVFTPYAVHGMDEAMGLQPTRLPWVCFGFGALGAILKIWFEYWASGIDWPINVGGRPWNSLPAFIPVTFEVMVLLAGLSTVAAFLISAKLFPGRAAVMPAAGVTNDRFVLVVAEEDASFEWREMKTLCDRHHAMEISEAIEEIRS